MTKKELPIAIYYESPYAREFVLVFTVGAMEHIVEKRLLCMR